MKVLDAPSGNWLVFLWYSHIDAGELADKMTSAFEEADQQNNRTERET